MPLHKEFKKFCRNEQVRHVSTAAAIGVGTAAAVAGTVATGGAVPIIFAAEGAGINAGAAATHGSYERMNK